jgi:ADP-heptose:LPS heptosyltransferase
LNRILVIRGGAIGDFILTLPALKVLRETYPDAHIEILGYKHIALLAENRFYAQAVRSIEYGPLSSFFARNSELSPELANYFASFDLIVSYLYDPDGIFEMNLSLAGARNILRGAAKIDIGAGGSRATTTGKPARVDEPGGEPINDEHAARQLARPIEELGLRVEDFSAKLYPSGEDRHMAQKFFGSLPRRTGIVVFHPGSGSDKKNWPIQNWIDLGNHLLASGDFRGSIVIVSGEADEDQIRRLEVTWKNARVAFAKNLPLPHVAAVLENSIFVGHDSGISHLAAAAGANCILLFGPTDPAVWAPIGEEVRVLRAPNGDLLRLDIDLVRDALDQELMRIGIST